MDVAVGTGDATAWLSVSRGDLLDRNRWVFPLVPLVHDMGATAQTAPAKQQAALPLRLYFTVCAPHATESGFPRWKKAERVSPRWTLKASLSVALGPLFKIHHHLSSPTIGNLQQDGS